MVVVFAALLLGVAVEVIAFVAVADRIHVLPALGLLLVVSALGPLVVKRVGLAVLTNARARLAAGEEPTRELLDGLLVLGGGVLLCVPGFVGDVIGLLLMVGPVRHVVIRLAGHRVAQGARLVRFDRGGVVDASTHDRPPPGRDGGEPPARFIGRAGAAGEPDGREAPGGPGGVAGTGDAGGPGGAGGSGGAGGGDGRSAT